MKVAGYCKKVDGLQDRGSGLYQALEETLLKLEANKDVASFLNMLQRITNDQKAETTAMADLQATIKAVKGIRAPEFGQGLQG